MRIILLLTAGVALAALGLCGSGCKKAKESASVDPHSAEGVMSRLQEQSKLLEAALARQDYAYLHDYGYYFNGLLQAFYIKLDDAEKQRMRAALDNLINLSGQLDRSAGGNRAEATAATVQKLVAALKELETQFQQVKRGRA